jgi:hypothetical protein
MRTMSATGARHARFHRSAASIATSLLVALAATDARAATVVGGSDLLDAASAAQLETWLGQGPIQLTNVFDKVAGNTSEDFHAAADGKGATFSLIEVTGYGGTAFDTPVLVGGYNPQSWSSNGAWNFTPDDADRTAFIFNLSQSLLFRQRLSGSPSDYGDVGYIQTYNHVGNGPAFGGGYDVFVSFELAQGYGGLYSYATTDLDLYRDLARYPASFEGPMWDVGQIEIFTISAAPVPEPATLALALAGLAAIALAAKHRSKRMV